MPIRPEDYNEVQGKESIHNKGIESTTADAIFKLRERYPTLNVEKGETQKIIFGQIEEFNQQLKNDLNEQEKNGVEILPSNRTAAAIRFLERFLNKDAPAFIADDNLFEKAVEVREAMCLTWLSIHDPKHANDLDNALKAFVEFSYEIQREKNIIDNIDDNSPLDSVTCLSGTITRLIQSRETFDDDVKLEFAVSIGDYFGTFINEVLLDLVRERLAEDPNVEAFNHEITENELSDRTIELLQPRVLEMMVNKFPDEADRKKVDDYMLAMDSHELKPLVVNQIKKLIGHSQHAFNITALKSESGVSSYPPDNSSYSPDIDYFPADIEKVNYNIEATTMFSKIMTSVIEKEYKNHPKTFSHFLDPEVLKKQPDDDKIHLADLIEATFNHAVNSFIIQNNIVSDADRVRNIFREMASKFLIRSGLKSEPQHTYQSDHTARAEIAVSQKNSQMNFELEAMIIYDEIEGKLLAEKYPSIPDPYKHFIDYKNVLSLPNEDKSALAIEIESIFNLKINEFIKGNIESDSELVRNKLRAFGDKFMVHRGFKVEVNGHLVTPVQAAALAASQEKTNREFAVPKSDFEDAMNTPIDSSYSPDINYFPADADVLIDQQATGLIEEKDLYPVNDVQEEMENLASHKEILAETNNSDSVSLDNKHTANIMSTLQMSAKTITDNTASSNKAISQQSDANQQTKNITSNSIKAELIQPPLEQPAAPIYSAGLTKEKSKTLDDEIKQLAKESLKELETLKPQNSTDNKVKIDIIKTLMSNRTSPEAMSQNVVKKIDASLKNNKSKGNLLVKLLRKIRNGFKSILLRLKQKPLQFSLNTTARTRVKRVEAVSKAPEEVPPQLPKTR